MLTLKSPPLTSTSAGTLKFTGPAGGSCARTNLVKVVLLGDGGGKGGGAVGALVGTVSGCLGRA